MFETVVIVWVLVLILVVVTLFAGVKTVSQGQVWTVERFGAYTRMLQPGLNFVLPYVDRVGRKLNVQEQVVEIPEQSVITRDNATVAVDGIIYYRVMEPEKAAYQVTNLTLALTTLAMTNIRAVIGEMELDATLSSRERINTALLVILDGATEPWGVKVSRVEIRKIEPPENLIRAMNLQMTAERERRAAVARAEGERAGGDPARRGREAGADPVRRGPPAGGAARRRGARGAGRRGGAGDADGVRRGGAAWPGGPALLHRRPLRAGVPGAGLGAEHAAGRGADGVRGAGRRHRAGDAVAARRRWDGGRRTAAACRRRPNRRRRRRSCHRRCRRSPPAPVARPGGPARRDERLDHLAGRRPGVAGDRDPRAGRVHDVARPGGLRHRAGRCWPAASASSCRW